MRFIKRLTRSIHIHKDIGQRFLKYIQGGKILDIPCGDGVNSKTLLESGFSVTAADLFQKQGEIDMESVDMTKPLPYSDCCFDGVLHSEGIEHVDNQISVLQELARVLKPGGILIVTTPNLLHLEGRLAFLLTGHRHSRRELIADSLGYWSDPKEDSIYFGHVFMINAFQLRFYLGHVGLNVLELDTTCYSWKSVLLAPLLYLPIYTATFLKIHREKGLPKELRRKIFKEILSGPALFGRKLIMVAQKPTGDASSQTRSVKHFAHKCHREEQDQKES